MAKKTAKKSKGKAEDLFSRFGKKVDKFMNELNEASSNMEKEFKEKFEDLKTAGEKLKEEAKNKERWKEVEGSLKKAGGELKNAFNAAFKKKKAS